MDQQDYRECKVLLDLRAPMVLLVPREKVDLLEYQDHLVLLANFHSSHQTYCSKRMNLHDFKSAKFAEIKPD